MAEEMANQTARELQALKPLLEDLPFVTGTVGLIRMRGAPGVFVRLDVVVDMPSAGPACDMCGTEPVWIHLPPGYPGTPPDVYLRVDFPPVPHLSSMVYGLRLACLTRRPLRDWWTGRTLMDVACTVHAWLNDAAAGLLVKPDDPFEPLIAGIGNPPVELDTDVAKENCRKHNGLWQTTAKPIDSVRPGICRLIVGDGDLATQVWYQPEPQTALWLDPPTTLDELASMVAETGFDRERFHYWAQKRDRLLVVLGVTRPCNVLGRPDAEEWVAFFTRQQGGKSPRQAWRVTTHLVQHSFTPRLARLMSGGKQEDEMKTVVVVGAGAMGSAVCDSLARTGRFRLGIVDNDLLQPHNLARHVLTGADVGRAKAQALAERLNALYVSDDPVATAVCKDVFRLSPADLEVLLAGAACVLDLSASIAVQRFLADLDHPEVPVVSAYQIASGRGTVLLAEATRSGGVDALDVAMMSRWRRKPLIAEWLTEKPDTVDIGGGCRSASARIADALVREGASWVADCVSTWLGPRGWPKTPVFGLLERADEPMPVVRTHWQECGVSSSASEAWLVQMTDEVESALNRAVQKAGSVETGGILIGQIDRQRLVIYVTEVWQAPPDSDASAVGFVRGRRRLKTRLAMLEGDTEHRLTYVGEWHSHPPQCGVGMSAQDSRTAGEMARKLTRDRVPALCAITNGSRHGVHVVEEVES